MILKNMKWGFIMGLFGNKESKQGVLKKYSVLYLGGHPANEKKTYNIHFYVLEDQFQVESQYGDKKLHPIAINYNQVVSFDIVQRQVSTVEGMVLFKQRWFYASWLEADKQRLVLFQ
jgi:hypothetical protein